MKPPSVLCVGKAAQDIFLIDDEFDPHCEGDVCYTHLPLGAKLDISQAVFASGGNATNVAVTLARQGIDTRYLWALGHDVASIKALQSLDEEGVDTSAVVQDLSLQASLSTVLVALHGGERTILNYKGILPSAHDVERMLRTVDKPDWVYPSSLGSIESLTKVVDWAVKQDIKVMLNPAGIELGDSQKLRSLLEDVEILVTNKEEMQQLVEGNNIEELVMHGLHYCPVIIVTDGRNGACASDGKTFVTTGLYDNLPSVERTGAGDAFAAGFLSKWLQGHSLKESLHFASANSSSVVQQIGAKAGILEYGAELKPMNIIERNI
ncbi:carbohydrate kinase family protein [Candidatus Saccharibacteria bacterium]|nr:carbohydrate kinase family protein [Candidatus Saccharibacteria bacterium]NCU40211.1 carbohydrate kinase family protein [Candidatus Saccharibacteria bacterium]